MEYQTKCPHNDIGGECPFCETTICCKCAGEHFAESCHVNRHLKLIDGLYCPSCKIKEVQPGKLLEHIKICSNEEKKWRQYFVIVNSYPEVKGGVRVP